MYMNWEYGEVTFVCLSRYIFQILDISVLNVTREIPNILECLQNWELSCISSVSPNPWHWNDIHHRLYSDLYILKSVRLTANFHQTLSNICCRNSFVKQSNEAHIQVILMIRTLAEYLVDSGLKCLPEYQSSWGWLCYFLPSPRIWGLRLYPFLFIV